MSEPTDGVMIALLPVVTDWCRIEMPHMTLVYAGKVADIDQTKFTELAKSTADLALLCNPLYLRVTGVETFGKGDDGDPFVDVFTLLPTPELLAMRRAVEGWNASEFPFRPHCTIGPSGQFVENRPQYIAFDRMVAAWGTDVLTFNLKRG